MAIPITNPSIWREESYNTIFPYSIGTGKYGDTIVLVFADEVGLHKGDVISTVHRDELRVVDKNLIEDFFENYTEVFVQIVSRDPNKIIDYEIHGVTNVYSSSSLFIADPTASAKYVMHKWIQI